MKYEFAENTHAKKMRRKEDAAKRMDLLCATYNESNSWHEFRVHVDVNYGGLSLSERTMFWTYYMYKNYESLLAPFAIVYVLSIATVFWMTTPTTHGIGELIAKIIASFVVSVIFTTFIAGMVYSNLIRPMKNRINEQ